MWIRVFLIVQMIISTAQYEDLCQNVIEKCHLQKNWPRCFENRSVTCRQSESRSFSSNFIRRVVNSSQEAVESPTSEHRVHIPSSALQKGKGAVGIASEENVLLVVTVLNSSYFPLRRTPTPRRWGLTDHSTHKQVMRELVLFVRVGNHALSNLTQPIRLIFKHNNQEDNGNCVFWQESEAEEGTGDWSSKGCDTNYNDQEFICSCNHLSFFAVLVNPKISKLDKENAVNLNYISYIGSSLSVFFTIVSLFIYACLQQRRPEKSISVHMQLTGALLCLHISFLLSKLWVWLEVDDEDGWGCKVLGFLLHWSLLATFSWTALEGFHLYLLLVQIFNIYIRRYLLKLSLLGWGVPTVVAVICGISGAYGNYSIQLLGGARNTSADGMCWISSNYPHRLVINYIAVVAYMSLVLLFNSAMLGVVVVKLWGLRKSTRGFSGGREGSGGWKVAFKKKTAQVCKDCGTVLGLSCVLGLAWGLAYSTYSPISLPGLYLFTVLNSLQGVFMFLWSLALTCKFQSDNNSSFKDQSTQKITESLRPALVTDSKG
ncbi:adhesion G-protein coupled receptor G5-like [Lampris incognitus]|uniref:adhesion G-protein coupled receptor G5-like n=1 Tax=Lampris incognitus TaxID=2546036 RepID=UPI0024B61E5D|nr:adhesion G-protein coupled receptor G5-like [Lampris incognitus]